MVKPDLYRAAGGPQNTSNLIVFKSFELAEQKNCSVVPREAVNKTLNATGYFFPKYLVFH
jgi:hypothetical protein